MNTSWHSYPKVCSSCKIEKTSSDFCKNSNRKDGLHHACRICARKAYKKYSSKNRSKINATHKKYCLKNKEKIRLLHKKEYQKNRAQYYNSYIKRTYGISIEEKNKIKIKQDFKCWICKDHEKNLTRGLVIDHNHKTGKIRGLLCQLCNSALGKFKEDRAAILNAVKYLEEFQ